MGCCAARAKGHIDEHAKWDYINLDDFHSTSSWSPISYLWVWIYGFIGVAVFALDCFTAVNLLILDRWASQIQPSISFKYSKWIFVGCIMFSFVLYLYEWARAIRVMRRGGIAESYMDPLAVQVQCMRGKGFKRFLVFASLTKSKKGTDYIAFFVYFQFNSAVRIIFAEGGRQFVNAVTLVAVAKADFVPIGKHAAKAGSSPVVQFFANILALWNHSKEQALVLGSMTFTLVIWLFSAICLILAVVFYIVFLWHYIPQSDGRLSVYCRRKIDRRLEKIVEKKVVAALEDSERKRLKNEAKFIKKHGNGSMNSLPGMIREPTLPSLGGYDEEKNTSLDTVRAGTPVSLPPSYTSRAPTADNLYGSQQRPTLPNLGPTPPFAPPRAMRQNTDMSTFSNNSYSSNAPLLSNSAEMGAYSRPHSPAGGLPHRLDRQSSDSSINSFNGMPPRAMTNSPFNPQRGPSGMAPQQQRMPPVRSNTAFTAPERTASPMGGPLGGPYGGMPPRSQTAGPQQPMRMGTPQSNPGQGQRPGPAPRQMSRQSFNRPFVNEDRPSFSQRSTPAPIAESSPLTSLVQSLTPPATTTSPAGSGYTAFNPYNATNNNTTRAPSVPAQAYASAQRRNMTTTPLEMQTLSNNASGGPTRAEPGPRSYTAPIDRNVIANARGNSGGNGYYGNVF